MPSHLCSKSAICTHSGCEIELRTVIALEGFIPPIRSHLGVFGRNRPGIRSENGFAAENEGCLNGREGLTEESRGCTGFCRAVCVESAQIDPGNSAQRAMQRQCESGIAPEMVNNGRERDPC
jgi:hypothetical protein